MKSKASKLLEVMLLLLIASIVTSIGFLKADATTPARVQTCGQPCCVNCPHPIGCPDDCPVCRMFGGGTWRRCEK